MQEGTTSTLESGDLRSFALTLRPRADAELLALTGELAARRRELDGRLAAVAAELARRSAPDAGHAGIAQRSGDRTAARLVERTTGVTADEARRLITLGARITDQVDPVGSAVAAGTVSLATADAIVSELDRCAAAVPAETRHEAAAALVALASGLRSAEVRREAREVRDQLDAEGVPDREERLHQQRCLSLTPLPTGMTRITGLLDPESAALVTDAFDQALSPRRGGPRFVDPAAQTRADRILDDAGTTEQLMVDTLVHIVNLAATADPGELFGQTSPAVRVHVTAGDLARHAEGEGSGAAVLEGQAEAVSPATAERLSCSGAIPILFDATGTRALNLGREQRLFSPRQRIALAARDGGCLIPGCDRPPAWCEAHHIHEYSLGGRTDVGAGVLLCRFHHRWLHLHRHRIVRGGDGFALRHAHTGTATPLPSKQRIRVGDRLRT
ncbi:MAG: DUF222 domain-containing protein [Micrococcales bacterium]|nr:DUF222 domain-containing protein [Micrococcales bacterium]